MSFLSQWARILVHAPQISRFGRVALLGCGLLSSLLYLVSIDVAVALRYPDYHAYTSQMVSELMAIAAPPRALLLWLLLPYNLLVFAFALGVWASAGQKRAIRRTAVALVGYGVLSTLGLLLAPMDVRGTLHSERDTLHILTTFAMSILIVAVLAFGAFVHGERFRLYTFATIGTVVFFGIVAGILSRPMPGPTPWLGLVERINIYTTMLWIMVFALSLMPVRVHYSETTEPASPARLRAGGHPLGTGGNK